MHVTFYLKFMINDNLKQLLEGFKSKTKMTLQLLIYYLAFSSL